MCKFSLITICLNPGDKLRKTLESAMCQSFRDFELIIKDGGSTDGSLDTIRDFLQDDRVKLFEEKDKSIYDAMNQAVGHAGGEYVFFLNCGDLLYDENVLARVAAEEEKLRQSAIEDHGASERNGMSDKSVANGISGKNGANGMIDTNGTDYMSGKNGADGMIGTNGTDYMSGENGANGMTDTNGMSGKRDENDVSDKDLANDHENARDSADRWILYGNIYSEKTKTQITPPSRITGFTCYRNIPCHQACFYNASLCKEKPFETKYKIRGDYEHFLWCFYQGNAKMHYMDATVAIYEGGGYSETRENLKRSKREHKEITQKYMGKAELFKYRAIMAITLAPLRTWISENPKLSRAYQGLVGKIYHR